MLISNKALYTRRNSLSCTVSWINKISIAGKWYIVTCKCKNLLLYNLDTRKVCLSVCLMQPLCIFCSMLLIALSQPRWLEVLIVPDDCLHHYQVIVILELSILVWASDFLHVFAAFIPWRGHWIVPHFVYCISLNISMWMSIFLD